MSIRTRMRRRRMASVIIIQIQGRYRFYNNLHGKHPSTTGSFGIFLTHLLRKLEAVKLSKVDLQGREKEAVAKKSCWQPNGFYL